MHRWTILLSLAALAVAPLGCAKKPRPTTDPDATATRSDPMDELAAIPGTIEAELALVLQPIHDVDRVVEQITTMPDRLGVDAQGLRAMVTASLRDGNVAVDLEVSESARAEIEQLLATLHAIVDGLRDTPKRVAHASKTIVGQGAKAVTLVAGLTAKCQLRLASPFTAADEKARIQAQLATVIQLDAEIKTVVGAAKSTVVELPARTTAALAKITSALVVG